MNTFDTLGQQGFGLVNYPTELRGAVEHAQVAWQDFCSLPLTEKQRYQAVNHSAGTGWEQDDEGGTGKPNRENFDILSNYKSGLSDPHPFVSLSAGLASSLQGFVQEFSSDIEHSYDIPGLAHTVRGSAIFLRFLHYFGEAEHGEIIAETHTDQSGFTLHLFETDIGCERLDPETRDWKSMPVAVGKAVVFGAMQMQLISHGRIPALTHRVVATEKTKSAGRFAVVAFIRLTDTPVYDKSAHGRLQERQPGFQYDLPPREFSHLFTNSHD